jgi:hypothetical protein
MTQRLSSFALIRVGLVSALTLLLVSFTHAGPTEAAPSPAPSPSPSPSPHFYGWIDTGVTWNTNTPKDSHNFGHLFTDRANEPLLNQFSLVAEKTIDSSSAHLDVGGRIWFMYGSDARYTKALGFLSFVTDQRVQPDFPELYASLHVPLFLGATVDFKFGKYVDPMSAETIDPRSNAFYSHSYIFNFGVPFTDLGFLSITHVNSILDVYAGLNRGVNIAFRDNNSALAFEGGLGLNLLGGNLTTVAMTHIGPENPRDNTNLRFLNDITTTWKVTPKLTLTNDLNLIYDQLLPAWGYGVANYVSYSLTDWLALNLRQEIWRDEEGFYVAQFRANNDALHILKGDTIPFDPSNLGGGKTTYFEVTFGATIKPNVPKPLSGLSIRPEVRWDRALTDSFTPFKQNTQRDQVTLAIDAVIQF